MQKNAQICAVLIDLEQKTVYIVYDSAQTRFSRRSTNMATPIAMPRQGNTVESCTIVEWHKQKGDPVAQGDVVFTYETDKATFEFEAPAAGTVLDTFYGTDEDVPVLTNVAVIGSPGENYDEHKPATASAAARPPQPSAPAPTERRQNTETPSTQSASASQAASVQRDAAISPRARMLAESKGIAPSGIVGTGPHDALSNGTYRPRCRPRL
jgi:pyruvate dehydrogenase E2 component (dihydrolipoamide acetyltransferase)